MEAGSCVGLVREINRRFGETSNRIPAAFTHSYGCQQNVSDGEKLNGLLMEMGYRISDSRDDADFILYNTCAVRGGAEDRVFGNVGALKHLKTKNPSLIIAVCGCMTQQKHIIEHIRNHFPFVDLVFGAGAMHQLPELLYRKLSEGGRVFSVMDPTFGIVEDLPVRREGSGRAWLPIMYGCDNFCTYCVVPYTRGRERSRNPGNILEEAAALVSQGFKEITLLGQNVNSYGKGLGEPINFSGLLRQICAIPGDFRVRFMTSHPKDCTRELIDTIGSQEKICNHLHLPVQSGSDRILERMNRGYDTGDYKELINYAKEVIPGITFSSDIIIGFPGETYEDVELTLDLVRCVEYNTLFTFIYSPRIGTKAYDMEDPVSHEEKSKWFQELLGLQEAVTAKKNMELVGHICRVLVDGPAKSGADGWLTGRNASNVIVDFQGPDTLIGKFADIRVTKPAHWAVAGELVE